MTYSHVLVVNRLDGELEVLPYSEDTWRRMRLGPGEVFRVRAAEGQTVPASALAAAGLSVPPTTQVITPQVSSEVLVPARFVGSLGASLWVFENAGWRGYIDFMSDGRYWTHWGYGNWAQDDAGVVHMRNTYDPFSFRMEFSTDRQSMTGMRSPDRLPARATFWTRYP